MIRTREDAIYKRVRRIGKIEQVMVWLEKIDVKSSRRLDCSLSARYLEDSFAYSKPEYHIERHLGLCTAFANLI